MKTELNRMGRIRLFPLLFQNVCSQSSRFLSQARRIVGSGDENVFDEKVTYVFRLFHFYGIFFRRLPFYSFSFLFAAVIDLLLGLLAVKKLLRKRHWDGQILAWAARCSGRKFCSEFFAYLRLHSADYSDLGIIGKIFSSCRSWV